MAYPGKTATTIDSKLRVVSYANRIIRTWNQGMTEQLRQNPKSPQPPMVNRVLTSPYLW
jgi:hypothetical protein